MAFIYALVHPETKEIRYIGATTKKPERRYKDHFSLARHKRKTPVQNWILKLERSALRPEQIIIEEVEDSVCGERERYWIQHHRAAGYRLLNVGEGGEGIRQKDDSVAKLYKEKKERRPDVLEKLRTQVKMIHQFTNTPEMRKAQSERMKGNQIPKRFGKDHHASKQVLINGIEYPSVKSASEAEGVSTHVIKQWVKKGKAQYLGPNANVDMSRNPKPNRFGADNPRSKKVLVGDKEYPSITAASEGEGVTTFIITQWLKRGKAHYLT